MVGNVSMDQNMIEVSGPKSAVEKVASAGVEVNVTGASNSLSANMEIRLYDSDNNVITQDNIEKQTDYARVSVEILAVKEVPIEIKYDGEPASGYMTTGVVEASPSTIKIAGSSVTLSNISKITIPAEDLSIAGADGDVVQDIDVTQYFANNVRLADSSFNGWISATVRIEPVVKRNLTLSSSAISFQNIPDDMEAALIDDEEEYTLQIEGLGDNVNAVTEKSLKGIIDVEQWMDDQELTKLTPGSYYMPVTVIISDNVKITDNVVVHVQIRKIEEQAQ
jgi:YbbR domain-containing protein